MKRLIHTTSTVLAVLFLLTATGCGTNRTADSGKNADSGQNESPPDSTFQIGDGTDAFADDTHQIAGSTDQITDQITDGTYEIAVALAGGTGRASVSTPAKLTVQDGKMTASIVWSSANYDYMLLDDVRYDAEITDGHSIFEIPVAALDAELPVIADTTAMSVPHEIEYTLFFDSSTLAAVSGTVEWDTMTAERELPLTYATQFRMTEYTGGYLLADISTTGRFLIIPEGLPVPEGLEKNIVPLFQPLDKIYLAATSAMDFFRSLGAIDHIRLSGTDENGWYIPEAKQALRDGSLLFAGKYNAPNYERIFSEQCDLAIESTMIYHSPKIKEQLEALGVPVLVERSSYEEHPLGRMEWIKFYGALLGKEAEAEAIFDAEAKEAAALAGLAETGKTAAFFYINSAGTVNVRKSEDYVSRMIDMAGGRYIFSDLDSGNALSSVNMTMEAFYDGAKNADLLIYNSTIDGELRTMDELLAKSPLLADFKAVKNGEVWCTGKNLFQEPMGLGRLIVDIHCALTGDVPDDGVLTYLHRLKL